MLDIWVLLQVGSLKVYDLNTPIGRFSRDVLSHVKILIFDLVSLIFKKN